MDLTFGCSKTLAPLGQSDLVVIVGVATVEEDAYTAFHCEKRSTQREQLVARHVPRGGGAERGA